jgi:hypothetical protein
MLLAVLVLMPCLPLLSPPPNCWGHGLWLQDAPGESSKPQEALGGPRKPQEAPGNPRRFQEAPGSIRKPQELCIGSPESQICDRDCKFEVQRPPGCPGFLTLPFFSQQFWLHQSRRGRLAQHPSLGKSLCRHGHLRSRHHLQSLSTFSGTRAGALRRSNQRRRQVLNLLDQLHEQLNRSCLN